MWWTYDPPQPGSTPPFTQTIKETGHGTTNKDLLVVHLQYGNLDMVVVEEGAAVLGGKPTSPGNNNGAAGVADYNCWSTN